MSFIQLATDTSKMSIGELSAITTISGLVIVFAMLLLLVFMIYIFGFVGKRASNKTASNSDNKAVAKAQKSAHRAVSAPVIAANAEEDEIIAVISAAIAMMYEGTGKKAIIRSVRPVSSARSAWADAGVRNNIRAF